MFQHRLSISTSWKKPILAVAVILGLVALMWFWSIPNLGASTPLPGSLTFISPIGNPRFALSKTVNNSAPSAGQQIQYTLRYSNTVAGSQAFNVKLYDFLPAGAQVVSSNPPATILGNGVILFTAPSLGPTTATQVATVQIVVPSGYDQLYNHALIEADGVSSTFTSLVTPVTQVPSGLLKLTKTGYATALQGHPLVYTLRAENAGSTALIGVTLADVLPAGVTFASASPAPDVTMLPVVRWSLGSLAPGQVRTVVLTGTAPSAMGTVLNTAFLDARQEVMDQKVFSTQILSGASILRVNKSASLPVAYVGDTLVYTLNYWNDGDVAATGVVLTDTLPAGVTVQSVNPPASSLTTARGVWNVGTLAPGQAGTVTIVVRVGGPVNRTLHNVADITGQAGSYAGHGESDTPVPPFRLYLPMTTKGYSTTQ